MEKHQNQDPFEHFDSALKDVLNCYDRDKNDLFTHLQALCENPENIDEQELTDDYVHNIGLSFAKASISVMESASDFDEKEAMLISLWLTDDNERVDKLRGLSKTEVHQYLDHNDTTEIIEELIQESSTTAELEENIMKRYKKYLLSDIYTLYGQLRQPESTEYDYDQEMFDQAQAVQELVDELEKIVAKQSEGYREGTDDGYSIAYTATDMLGELTSGFALDVVRWQDVDDDGNDETNIRYHMVTSLRQNCESFMVLPGYVRNYVQGLVSAGDSMLRLTSEDLVDETTEVYVEFNYNIFASNDGAFWYGYGLTLRINGNEIYIPDKNTEPDHTENSLEGQTPISETEQKLFNSIFSVEEFSDIAEIVQELEYQNDSTDVIDAFSKNIAELYGLGRSEHIARARVLVEEFKRLSKR